MRSVTPIDSWGFWYFGLKSESPLHGVSTSQLQINLLDLKNISSLAAKKQAAVTLGGG